MARYFNTPQDEQNAIRQQRLEEKQIEARRAEVANSPQYKASIKPPDILDQTFNSVVRRDSTPFLPENAEKLKQESEERAKYITPTFDWKIKEKDDSYYPVLPDFLGGGTLPYKFDPTPSSEDQFLTAIAGTKSLIDSASLGIIPSIEKAISPDYYEFNQNLKKQSPVASGIGEVAGYLVPGLGQAKALKLLPKVAPVSKYIMPTLNKILPRSDIIGKIAGGGLQGLVEGSTMGAVVGANEAYQQDRPIIQGAVDTAKDWGTMGAGLGALIGGGTGIYNKIKGIETPTMPSISNIEQPSPSLYNTTLPRTTLDDFRPVSQEIPTVNNAPIRANNMITSEPIIPQVRANNMITSSGIQPPRVNEVPQMGNAPRYNLNWDEISGAPITPQQTPIVDTLNNIQTSITPSKNWFQKTWEDIKDIPQNLGKFSDYNYGLKKIGSEIVPKGQVSKSYMAADNANTLYKQKDLIKKDRLVDINGNIINDAEGNPIGSFLDIYKKTDGTPFTNIELKQLADYQTAKLNLDRLYNTEKGIFFGEDLSNLSGQEFQDAYKRIVSKYNSTINNTSPEIVEAANKFSKFQDAFNETWLVDSGLVTRQQMDNLKELYPDYFYVQSNVPKNNVKVKTPGNRTLDPIEKAEGGAVNINPPHESTLAQIDNITTKAIDNRIRQELYNEVIANPQQMNKYVEILDQPIESNISNVIDEINNVPAAFNTNNRAANIVDVFINGKKVRMLIKDQGVWDALTKSNRYISQDTMIAPIAKAINSVIRAGATTANPIFAVKNVVKDLQTAYLNGGEANLIKYGKNYLNSALASKGWSNQEWNNAYQQFKNLKGDTSGLLKSLDETTGDEWLKLFDNAEDVTRFQKLKKEGGKAWETYKEIVSFSENFPRVSEFKRVLDETGDVTRALYAGNNITTNFARFGPGTKMLNDYFLFSNAGFQGIRSTIDAVKRNPKGYAAKFGVAVIAPKVISEIWSRTVNEDKYRDIDQRIKDDNHVFMLPNGDYIKIPISRDTTVALNTIGQRIFAHYVDKKDIGIWDTLFTLLDKTTPVNPLTNNPLSALAGAYVFNRNWTGGKVVSDSMNRLEPKDQYNEDTNELLKFVGQKLNISPQKADYVVKSYFGFFEKLADSMMKGEVKGQPSDIVTGLEGIVKPIYSDKNTQNYDDVNQFYNNLTQMNQKLASAKLKLPPNIKSTNETRALNTEVNKLQDAADQMTKIRKGSYSQDPKENKKIINDKIIEIAKFINKNKK